MDKLLSRMTVDALIGFVAYMIRDRLTGHMPADWRNICDFSLGFCYLAPPVLLKLGLFSEGELKIPHLKLRVLSALVYTGIPFIIGAVAGFRFFPLEEEK